MTYDLWSSFLLQSLSTVYGIHCHVADLYIYQNSQKYNQQYRCRLSLLFFFTEIRRCVFGAPCSRRIGSFVLFCITETHIHLRRKIGFGKPKILVTFFEMLKCERTGNLYKDAHLLLELCRTCAESIKCEVHTSLSCCFLLNRGMLLDFESRNHFGRAMSSSEANMKSLLRPAVHHILQYLLGYFCEPPNWLIIRS